MPLIPVDEAPKPGTIKLKTGSLIPADEGLEPGAIKLKTGRLVPVKESTEESPNLLNKPIETLAKSGGEFFGSILSAIGHPIQTAKAIGGLGAGIVQKAIPGKQDQETFC